MADGASRDARSQDEWLWGWDPTPGIVSVWAEEDGLARVWRRIPESAAAVYAGARFRPWLLLRFRDDIRHVGPRLGREGDEDAFVTWRELGGPGELRYLVS